MIDTVRRLKLGAASLIGAFCLLGTMGLPAVPAIAQGDLVTDTPAGHRYGREDAPLQLIEFMSYTCAHCGTFAVQGDAPLQIAYIAPGIAAVEYRPMISNVLDLTVSMLVSCGGAERFTTNHAAFMMRQDEWLAEARRATPGQLQAWSTGATSADARRTMASALDLYTIVEKTGMRRTDVNTCLADQKLADRLMTQADASRAQFAVPGTPSFALNGKMLEGVHDWAALERALADPVGRARTPSADD